MLMADTQYNITCEAIGSRPQAKISWHREKEDFRRGKVSTGEGNKSLATGCVGLPAVS